MAQGTGDRSSWAINHPTQQADDEVSHSGEHLRAVAFAHLRSVFVEGGIAHPMEAILNTPMATVEYQQLAGSGLLRAQVGDDTHPFGALLAGFHVGNVPLDLTGLADVGEIEVVVQRGGGTDRALLDTPMGFIVSDVLRGE